MNRVMLTGPDESTGRYKANFAVSPWLTGVVPVGVIVGPGGTEVSTENSQSQSQRGEVNSPSVTRIVHL